MRSWSTPCLLIVFAIGFGPLLADNSEGKKKKEVVKLPAYQLAAYGKLGVSPDGEGAVRFLRSLMPAADDQKKIAALIAKLGADSFAQRQFAENQLSRFGERAMAALVIARASDEVEVSARAKRLIRRLKHRNTTPAIICAFEFIRRDRPAGGVSTILDVLPRFRHPMLERRAGEVLATIATPADQKRLEAELARERPIASRIAAIRGLAAVLKDDALEKLEPLLAADQPEPVQLAAARVLAMRGKRVIFAPLVRLLESENSETRWLAISLLSECTRDRFVDPPYPDKLTPELLGKIKTWLKDEAPTADVIRPVGKRKPPPITGYVTAHFGDAAARYDADGREMKKIACSPYDTRPLPGGRLLVCERGDQQIVEFDKAGKRARTIGNLLGPADAEPLGDGHFLVLENEANRAVEIDAQGKRLWSVGGLDNAYDVDRLDNGNTIVADSGNGRLVEFDPAGEVVWEVGGLDFPNNVLRLDDGRTLYTTYTSGGVIMLGRDGKPEWQRVFDGATLFSIAVDGDSVHVSDGARGRILVLGLTGGENEREIDLGEGFVDAGFVRE